MFEQRQLSPERIGQASDLIDPAFLRSRLLTSGQADETIDLSLFAKLETENPIGSFKGRGASLFVRTAQFPSCEIVTASAGNFGQGLAYCATRAGHKVTVFASTSASPLKVEQMKRHGARVVLEGADFDRAKERAKAYSEKCGAVFVEDGAHCSIAEGAGTIAAELTSEASALDAVFVPLGNGALASGVGCWFKHFSPATKVVAVAAEKAPSMALSWRERRSIETRTADTIADGIAVRVPVPYALNCLWETVDDVLLVSDTEILGAMHHAYETWGVHIEPAGAAGLAGILQKVRNYRGARVATVLCGGNLTPEQMAMFFGSSQGRTR